MVHTYKVTGMTCNGCRSHVEKTLQEVDGVKKADVNLEKAEAVIEMDKHVPLDILETALQKGGGNYHISVPDAAETMPSKNDILDTTSSEVAMTHTYEITGMTCNGCRSHVEKALQEVAGVTKADVNLEKAEAVISMEKHIPLEVFEAALQKEDGKYHISVPGASETKPYKNDILDTSSPEAAMTHTYTITGMTCNGCRSHVEKALQEVSGVIKADVHLEKAEAVISMEKHIPVEVFEAAIQKEDEKYHISVPGSSETMPSKNDILDTSSSEAAMTHTYKITGMTCNGCRSHVEKALQEVEGVKKADVNLEKAEAVISMEKHIPVEVLEAALQKEDEKYHISVPGSSETKPSKNDILETPSSEEKQETIHTSKTAASEATGMKHIYTILGMTCNGCRAHVEETLNKVNGVTNATVDLEKAEAVIEMQKHVKTGVFEDALQKDGGNYHILDAPKNGKLQQHFEIVGMTCSGCREHVQDVLQKVDGVEKAEVDLEKARAVIYMKKPVPVTAFQEALLEEAGSYNIFLPGQDASAPPKPKKPAGKGTGTYYCPMHCEGDKTYDKPGDCPVCGMDLVEEVSLAPAKAQYTCPMHPEIVEDEPGSCPICGMDLVRIEPDVSGEKKTYNKLVKKFKIAVAFTLPIFLIAMGEMIPGNPIYEWMDLQAWNWVQFALSLPVVFYATWMFFERAYRSIKSWNLNMFTLIGIGAGVAWTFSVFGMVFPDFFPAQFKTHEGTVHVYFEAATVILTLVLMGQVLEARAHSRTNSAIKELLKLAPNKATIVVDGEEKVIDTDKIEVGRYPSGETGRKNSRRRKYSERRDQHRRIHDHRGTYSGRKSGAR